MSYSAAQDLKEQVRQATNIVDLIGSYLQVRQQGRHYVALCPWHDDSRPSLQINPERQSWKCWPCDVGGDIFSFVMKRENVDFPQAVRLLAERAGIEIRQATGVKTQPGSPNDKQTLYQAMAWAERQFHECLLHSGEAEAAREYLRSRDVSEASLQRFHLGYAPHQWRWLLDRAASTPYSAAVLEALGLVIKNERGNVYDRFRGRVVFPIRDPQRKPIAIGGRVLPEFADDKSAKYINSPETRLYTKSEQLYGLDVAKEHVTADRHLLVMEGYTDVILCNQVGLTNVVAVCGTALTIKHVHLLRRFADRVTLVLDGDEAGQRRAAEVLELFVASPLELRIATLPNGLDPCDFVLQRGAEALRRLVDESPEAFDYHVHRVTHGINLASDTHRVNQALDDILGLLARSVPASGGQVQFRENHAIARLSRQFQVEEWRLRDQLAALRSKSQAWRNPAAQETQPAPHISGWDFELFVLLISNPDAIAAVIEKLSADDMRSAPARTLLEVYQQLEANGVEADFTRVMDAVEELELKNILVELCEAADRMESEDPELQLRDLLAAYAQRRNQQMRREHLAALESGNLAEDEELSLLNKLFESKKNDS